MSGQTSSNNLRYRSLGENLAIAPFAGLAIALAIGIWAGFALHGYLTFILFAVPGVSILMLQFLFKGSASVRRQVWWWAFPLVCAIGVMRINTETGIQLPSTQEQYLGEICGVNNRLENPYVNVKITGEKTENGSVCLHPFVARIYLMAAPYEVGDMVEFTAGFKLVAGDEYGNALFSKGISATAYVENRLFKKIGKSSSLSVRLAMLKHNASEFIGKCKLRGDTSGFLKAFLLGERDEFDSGIREVFAHAGISHIFALSGLHVGIVMMLLMWLTAPLNLFGLRRTRYFFVITGLIFYAVVTGGNASVIRATFMAVTVLVALIFEKRSFLLNSLCLAAFVILFFEPRQLFNVGFQLSFACVGGIVVWNMTINKEMKEKRLWRTVCGWLMLPIVIFLTTWPLQAYHFGWITLLFLPLNLIVLPLLPPYVICALVYFALTAMGMDCNILGSFLDYGLETLHSGADFLASNKWSQVEGSLNPLFPLVYLVALSALSYTIINNSKRGRILSGLCTVTTVVLLCYPERLNATVSIKGTSAGCCLTRVDKFSREQEYLTGLVEGKELWGNKIIWLNKNLKTDYIPASPEYSILVLGPKVYKLPSGLLTASKPNQIVLHPAVCSHLKERMKEYADSAGVKVVRMEWGEFSEISRQQVGP